MTDFTRPTSEGFKPQAYDENGIRYRDRLEPDEAWIDSKECARLLCCAVGTLSIVFRVPGADVAVRRRSRSKRGRRAQSVGYLYNRVDVLTLHAIRLHARVGISAAMRLLVAIRKGHVDG